MPRSFPAPASAPALPARRFRKLPNRHAPVAFAFFMAGVTALPMCCVIMAADTGVGPGYLRRVLGSCALAMPVAFCCVMGVRPLVMRRVAATAQS